MERTPTTGGSREQGASEDFRLTRCRVCGGQSLYPFLSLGVMPVPNGFVSAADLGSEEPRYHLGAVVCMTCGLVQLTHAIPAERMFRNYLYIPSTSRTMLDHFAGLAAATVRQWSVRRGDLVVDVGSNDGTLLRFFREYDCRILGIDPALNLAQVARLNGIETLAAFFTRHVADQVRATYGAAAVITATNVLAHVYDLHDFCDSIRELLADNGVFVCEFPYLVHLLDQNEFDTIYHEHLSYFALRPLTRLFKEHALRLIDATPSSVHGGSLRISIVHDASRRTTQPIVHELLAHELRRGLATPEPYDAFAERASTIQADLEALLTDLRQKGKRIAGYGASAKGNVLLNACRIGPDLVEFIVDSIPYKQGRFTPGTHIPIFPEKKLAKDPPDYILLMAWNFADEILEKLVRYRALGGQVIIHVPSLRIAGAPVGRAPAAVAVGEHKNG